MYERAIQLRTYINT
jgi:hypothetical protein